MISFILITIFFSGGYHGAADTSTVTGIEFSNLRACEVARAVVNQHMDKLAAMQTELLCVPKG